MDDNTRDARAWAIYQQIERIETRKQFREFASNLLTAWQDGVFDNDSEGQKQDIEDYLEGIVGVMYAETSNIDERENREPPSWSMLAWLLHRAFNHT